MTMAKSENTYPCAPEPMPMIEPPSLAAPAFVVTCDVVASEAADISNAVYKVHVKPPDKRGVGLRSD